MLYECDSICDCILSQLFLLHQSLLLISASNVCINMWVTHERMMQCSMRIIIIKNLVLWFSFFWDSRNELIELLGKELWMIEENGICIHHHHHCIAGYFNVCSVFSIRNIVHVRQFEWLSSAQLFDFGIVQLYHSSLTLHWEQPTTTTANTQSNRN